MDKKFNEEKEKLEMWQYNTISIDEAKSMAELIHNYSYVYAVAFARKINLKEKFEISRVLDIGGGSGCFR